MPPPNETKRKQGIFLFIFLLAVGFAKPCLAAEDEAYATRSGNIGEVFTDGSAPPLTSPPLPPSPEETPSPSPPPAPPAAEEPPSPSQTDGDGREGITSAEVPTSEAVAPPLLDDLDADGSKVDAASKAGDQQGTEQTSPKEGGRKLVYVIHEFPKCRGLPSESRIIGILGRKDYRRIQKEIQYQNQPWISLGAEYFFDKNDDIVVNDTRFNTPPQGFVNVIEERVYNQQTGVLVSTTGEYGRPLFNETQVFRFSKDVAQGYKEIFHLTYWLKVYLDKVYEDLEDIKSNYRLILFRGNADELTKRMVLDKLQALLIYAQGSTLMNGKLKPPQYYSRQYRQYWNTFGEPGTTDLTEIHGGIFLDEYNSQYDLLIKSKSAESILDGLVKLELREAR